MIIIFRYKQIPHKLYYRWPSIEQYHHCAVKAQKTVGSPYLSQRNRLLNPLVLADSVI
jgi:hypothetical protein